MDFIWDLSLLTVSTYFLAHIHSIVTEQKDPVETQRESNINRSGKENALANLSILFMCWAILYT